MSNNVQNTDNHFPTICIKKIEGSISRTYTDVESKINLLQKLSSVTNRSFNDVLKAIVDEYIKHGRVYDSDNDQYIFVKDLNKMFKFDNENKVVEKIEE
ncbi:hypothetical protein [Wukongibacter baidiensis]